MIWLKRLLPLLLIGMAAGGYYLWDKWHSERQAREERELATVTAQVWIASAKYRNEPEKYLKYRDSILQASGVPRERVFEFLKYREDRPEDFLPFAQQVQDQVDSLFRIEDSIARIEEQRVKDSVKAADTAAQKR